MVAVADWLQVWIDVMSDFATITGVGMVLIVGLSFVRYVIRELRMAVFSSRDEEW